ncbi:alcohol dehydrogenase GroES-like domain protein, partial [Vibrio parahaemolyticus IDH02640]
STSLLAQRIRISKCRLTSTTCITNQPIL